MQLSEFQLALDRGKREFPWVSLEGLCLRGMTLAGLSLRQAKLDRSDFSDADCTGAMLLKVSATETQWTAARLDRANGQRGNFSRSTFERAQLVAAQLQNADLTNSTFRHANLQQADLTGARLLGACFAAADLTGARLDSEAIAQADFSGATMPDGRIFDADWQPSPIAPSPDETPEAIDPELAAILQRDRPHKHLLPNREFAVPNVGPPPPPPVPTSLLTALKRLPRPLLALWCLGYVLWGSSLGLLDAPPQSWLLVAASSLTGLGGIAWGFMALTGGAIAVMLAAPLPQQLLSLGLGVPTGLVVALGTKVLIGISFREALRNGLLAFASATVMINLVLGFAWIGLIGALACTFVAMPLWPVAIEQNLSTVQKSLIMAGLATCSLAIGRGMT